MNELSPTPAIIGEIYNKQAVEYSDFAEGGFSWRFIERPAIQRYLEPYISPESKILDIGTGTGRVIGLLKEMGAQESNIIGIDVSEKLLAEARRKYPSATFIQASIDDFILPIASIDIATANMVFQYIDNDRLYVGLDKLYKALTERGLLCFTEPHPVRSDTVREASNNNQWVREATPWGGEVVNFNRDPYSLVDLSDFSGFSYAAGWETLPISEEGKTQPKLYREYSNHYSRAGYLWRKADSENRWRMWFPTRNILEDNWFKK